MNEQLNGQVPSLDRSIIFENVSKFYGDVLGVNRVNLAIPPGITSLVGPNGAGKTTLMNLMNGLIRPSQGSVVVCGVTPEQPQEFFRMVGYCSQFDSFPKGVTGREFVSDALTLHGYDPVAVHTLTCEAIERVNLTAAADRKVAGYSKGMRQRIRLAQAIAHRPTVLILDEPLNGLDPMARAESMALFEEIGREGLHVVISSHILHEVDRFSDRVILLSSGYVVAEGDIHAVRMDVTDQPMQIMVRCSRPGWLAAQFFGQDHIVEAKLHPDGEGVAVRTKDIERFYLLLNEIVASGELQLEAVAPADDDAHSIYEYLIGVQGASA
jgi:ABC-2 type transport system ATP-binding protein